MQGQHPPWSSGEGQEDAVRSQDMNSSTWQGKEQRFVGCELLRMTWAGWRSE